MANNRAALLVWCLVVAIGLIGLAAGKCCGTYIPAFSCSMLKADEFFVHPRAYIEREVRVADPDVVVGGENLDFYSTDWFRWVLTSPASMNPTT